MAKPLPSFTDGCSLQDKLNELRASETCQWACGEAQRKLGVFFEWTQVSTETGAGHGAGCVPEQNCLHQSPQLHMSIRLMFLFALLFSSWGTFKAAG